jgi:hypothetical protein
LAHDVPVPDPPVDLIQITGQGGGMEEYFLRESTPFYRRRILGIF